jgi:hypothetical protein
MLDEWQKTKNWIEKWVNISFLTNGFSALFQAVTFSFLAFFSYLLLILTLPDGLKPEAYQELFGLSVGLFFVLGGGYLFYHYPYPKTEQSIWQWLVMLGVLILLIILSHAVTPWLAWLWPIAIALLVTYQIKQVVPPTQSEIPTHEPYILLSDREAALKKQLAKQQYQQLVTIVSHQKAATLWKDTTASLTATPKKHSPQEQAWFINCQLRNVLTWPTSVSSREANRDHCWCGHPQLDLTIGEDDYDDNSDRSFDCPFCGCSSGYSIRYSHYNGSVSGHYGIRRLYVINRNTWAYNPFLNAKIVVAIQMQAKQKLLLLNFEKFENDSQLCFAYFDGKAWQLLTVLYGVGFDWDNGRLLIYTGLQSTDTHLDQVCKNNGVIDSSSIMMLAFSWSIGVALLERMGLLTVPSTELMAAYEAYQQANS